MPTTETTPLRVLIVDDNRDGADALGLLVEALGNQVHVTYRGAQALDVATAFRPDLMFVDLVMPDMDGCDLVMRFRDIPDFAQTKIVAITGLKEDQYKALALKAGCNAVLTKPVALAEIKAVLAGVVPTPTSLGNSPTASTMRARPNAEQRLPMDEARRIRSDRPSKTLTQSESEAAICHGIIRFQKEYLGWTSEHIQVHFVRDLLIVRIHGALTLAERQLGKSLTFLGDISYPYYLLHMPFVRHSNLFATVFERLHLPFWLAYPVVVLLPMAFAYIAKRWLDRVDKFLMSVLFPRKVASGK